MQQTVNWVLVWPLWWRAMHLLLALCTLALLGSGWLLASDLVGSEDLYQFLRNAIHLPAGNVLAVLLPVRLYFLLTDKGVGGFAALLPRRANLAGMLEMLRFYQSLGRGSPPRYFAHNPLWGPIYLLLWTLLLVLVLSGLGLAYQRLRLVFGLDLEVLVDWHAWATTVIGGLVIAHIVTALAQDARGEGSDVSATLNGHRTFAGSQPDTLVPPQVPSIHLNQIK